MKKTIYAVIPFALLATTAAHQLHARELHVQRAGKIAAAMIRNDDTYVHQNDANIDFGSENYAVMLGVEDGPGTVETAGFVATDRSFIIWSPGDRADVPVQPPPALLYILDEDRWEEAGPPGDPFTNGGLRAYVDNTGVWQTSAAEQKSNVARLTGALEKLQGINAYRYEFAPNAEEQTKGALPQRALVVSANELREVLPDAVGANAHGETWVNYSQITPLLIEAIKENQATIEELQRRLDVR